MSAPAPAPLPTVSVVIPAYNRAATIRPATESVLRQTWGDLEVLIVDDGSTDGTMEEAAKLRDPRVRLLQTPRNLGAGGARNTGVAAARGAWIAFQDSDDEWLPRKLEKQMARLLAAGGAFAAAYCGMIVVGVPQGPAGGNGGRPRVRYVPRPDLAAVEGDLLRTILRGNVVSTQTLVVRRDVFEAVGGFDERLRALEDRECAIRLARHGPIACIDEPLVLQRFSPNSLTRDVALQARSKTQILEKHLDLLHEHPDLLAELHYGIAYDWHRAGDPAAARRALAGATAVRGFRPRFWLRCRLMAARLAAAGLGELLRRPPPAP